MQIEAGGQLRSVMRKTPAWKTRVEDLQLGLQRHRRCALLMPGAGDARRGWGDGRVKDERRGDALGEALGNLALAHRRPILDRVDVHQMHRVALAAEGAGAG